MAFFVIRARHGVHGDRNCTQVNAFIVSAADETAARAAVLAMAPDGESRPKADWECLALSADPGTATNLLIVGTVIRPGPAWLTHDQAWEKRPGQ